MPPQKTKNKHKKTHPEVKLLGYFVSKNLMTTFSGSLDYTQTTYYHISQCPKMLKMLYQKQVFNHKNQSVTSFGQSATLLLNRVSDEPYQLQSFEKEILNPCTLL